ncbi:keratin, type II cytoskeletal 2 epidermal-like [Panicum hallii]|uniref:keratin, type II cytoskeletal 2 epidermal-like n=1 Tax=Panicum hallii TaxID=206008 RepID=UPI000DF4D0B3|nr:keratin, type II cytoskeletal 2 epidermal-like [Panicum hallii]
MGGGSGGCQRRAEAAAEVRRGGELGKRKSSANVGVGMQEWVRGELQDVLGVQKKAWSCGSRCWHAGGMRGGSGSGGAMWGGRVGSSAGWGATTWVLGRHGTEESGAGTAGARHMAGEGGGGWAQRKQRRRELEVDNGD